MGATFRVLVIEEDPGLRELFKVLLEGYRTVFPETSSEAHRLLQESSHDLLILDEDHGALERRWGVRRPAGGPTLLIAPDRRVSAQGPDAATRLVLPKPFLVNELLHFIETIRETIRAGRNTP